MAALPQFSRCLTEKMLTYALGRGLHPYDRRTVEGINRNLAASGYHFQSLIFEIVHSAPFQMGRGDGAIRAGQRSQAERGSSTMITKKALPRRTFLRGMGTAVALPFLDAMVPALAAARIEAAGAHGLRVRAQRHHHEWLESGLRRPAARIAAHPEAARALSPGHHPVRKPDAQYRTRFARWRGRSRPLLRFVPDGGAAAQDGDRYQGRRLVRSDRGEPGGQADALSFA